MALSNPVLVSVGIYVAYVALVAIVWRVNRVDYLRLAEDRRSVVRGIVVPIGLGALLLAAVTSILGRTVARTARDRGHALGRSWSCTAD